MSIDIGLKFDRSRPLDVIAMGRVAVDLYAEQIGCGIKDAQSFRKYLGGCAGNIAVGAARLGLKTSMLSQVGADDFGQFLLQTLKDESVDIAHVQVSRRYLTGLVILGVCPPDHFPLIFYRNDCADLFIDADDIKPEYIASAKAIVMTGTGFSHTFSRETHRRVIGIAKKIGTAIIVDVDYRPVLWGITDAGDGETRYQENAEVSRVMSELLAAADLVVGTEEEIKIAGGNRSLDKALAHIRRLSPAPIVMKKGERGCELFLAEQSLSQNFTSYAATVLNVLGAGDAFMSGLLSGLLRGLSFAQSCARANAAGAIVVGRHACAQAMPSLDEIDYVLASEGHHQQIKLNRLHQQQTIKNHERCDPLPILAFCHRWQLEESCLEHRMPLTLIADFKRCLAQAVIEVAHRESIKNPHILVDPIYGAQALREVSSSSIGVMVPIEMSKSLMTEWLLPQSAYEIVLKQPPAYGIKLLWHFHYQQPEDEQKHQKQRLRELFQATSSLDRRLMLELLLTPGYEHDERALLNAITTVYQDGVFPYWWKLPAMSAQGYSRLSELLAEFDSNARVVILGGEARPIEEYGQLFAEARAHREIIGFAIGRSAFWPSWLNFVRGQASLSTIKNEIASIYSNLYKMWMAS